MDEQLQTKNDEIRILFLKISKVEYLSKACACRDLADDSKLQVSSLHYKAALLLDEVDRVNLELTNVEYANRFLVEVDETLSTEQKQGEVAEKKINALIYLNLMNLKALTSIDLAGGGGKSKKKCALPHNQILINGFFAVSGSAEGHMPLNIISININVSKLSFPPSASCSRVGRK